MQTTNFRRVEGASYHISLSILRCISSRTLVAVALAVCIWPSMSAPAAATAASSRSVVPVLVYHSLTEDSRGDRWLVPVARFEAQLDHLASAGYAAISMDKLDSVLRGRSVMPRNPVLITFDDGYKDTATLAMPVLTERSLPWTVFLATARVARGTIVSTEDVMAMSISGATIAAHTRGHVDLTHMPVDQARKEILRSREDIRRLVGKAPKYFAYPFGSNNQVVRKLVREAGFTLAFGTRRGSVHCSDQLMDLSRLAVDGTWGIERFKKEMSDATRVTKNASVTLSGENRMISPRDRMRFNGRLTGNGGMPLPCSPVRIQNNTAGSPKWLTDWTRPLITDSSGDFAFTRSVVSPIRLRAQYTLAGRIAPVTGADGTPVSSAKAPVAGVVSSSYSVRMGGRMGVRVASTISQGKRARITGRLLSLRGRLIPHMKVTLEARRVGASSWRAISVRRSDAKGRVAFRVAPKVNTRYRLVMPGRWLTSAAETQKVRARVSLWPASRKVRYGSAVRFFGSVTPSHPGAKVALQQLVRRGGANRWVTMRYVMLDGRSRLSTYLPVSGRSGRFRLSFSGDRRNAASSATTKVTVTSGSRN